MSLGRILQLTSVLCASALPLASQATQARISLGGGSATDLQGVRSGAYALGASLAFAPDRAFALSLSGRGTRFTNQAWSLGGGAAAALRIPLPQGFSLLLNGSGDAIRDSYRTTYLSAEATPALEWRTGALSLWAGGRAALARTSFETGAIPATPFQGSQVSRSLVGPAFGGGLFFASRDLSDRLSLGYREEHGNPDGVSVVDRLAVLAVRHGSIGLAGSLGVRRAPDEHLTFGSARLSFGVARGIELLGSAESYPSNRLTGAPAGRAFTAGVAFEFGGAKRAAPLPKPSGVPAANPALTRLSLSAPRASRVEVAGDWNHWNRVPLTRAPNGVWYVDLAIPPGWYRYAFRVDGKSWEVPKGVAAVNDGFGGKSAWLSVAGTGRNATQSANRKEAP